MPAMDNADVKLVIRAPNQNVDDQPIACKMDWTIEKLKTHLCEVYPNNPEPNEQKLIYSGRLLRDHLQLKDILRLEDNTSVHIFHLVCSQHASDYEEDYSTRSSQICLQSSDSEAFSDDSDQDYSSDSSDGSQSTSSTATDDVSSDNTVNSSQPTPTSQDPYNQIQYMSEMYMNYFAHQQANNICIARTGSGLYSSSQLPEIEAYVTTIQNMYSSYFTNYFQYIQNFQMSGAQPAAFGTMNQVENIPPAPPAAAPVHNPPDNRNIPMNPPARGVARAMDDDNEHINRDWLDYIYLCCRGFVLFSIVYFYSSPERLILVIGLAFIALLYQEGWIFVRLRHDRVNENRQRARPRRVDQGIQVAENQINTDDEAYVQSQNENTDGDRPNVNEIEAIMDGDDPPHAQNHRNVQQTPHSPVWTFILSFFSSLIPEPPAPVNIN